ncbi:metalloendopeptidase [Pichia kluyveri]|uniref:Metalloendopeptidase n=1 Tax=Pichia kluyveri TaxID=36015 RepID=A0AAV5R5X9_PICKL|nr:metalloendopeptidase [Pichia kluyveri]
MMNIGLYTRNSRMIPRLTTRLTPRPLTQVRLQHYGRRKPTYVYFDQPKSQYQGYQRRSNGNSWRDIWRNMNVQQRRIAYSFGGMVFFFIVLHIQQAPVTHRYRLMITADWIENIFTNMSFRQVMSQYGAYVLPSYHPLSKQVSSIMVRLISAAHDYTDPDTGEKINLFTYLGKSDIPLDEWEFYVIDDVRMGQASPNAFVIGGGKVFIFKSILPICEDEDGLATVLSHELGHLLADHLGEKLTLSPFFITLQLILFSLFGTSQPGDILVNAFLNTSFSREMETEADYIGLMVMSRACFNPQQAPKLWKNMMNYEKKVGQNVPELLSTHPSSEKRFQNISQWMPRAVGVYDRSGCSQRNAFDSWTSLLR